MPTIILLRHGQSQWNLENRFTGWTDIPLTGQGCQEAVHAAKLIKESGCQIDVAFTSLLARAVETLRILQTELSVDSPIVRQSWRLNERHYGSLQGLNKADAVLRFGNSLVMDWRRSYTSKPPALELDDHRHPRFDRRYSHIPDYLLPRTESLADTELRILPYWHKSIMSELRSEKRVLIVAHGNSLRALVRWIEKIPPSLVQELIIPTGIPMFYQFENRNGTITKIKND